MVSLGVGGEVGVWVRSWQWGTSTLKLPLSIRGSVNSLECNFLAYSWKLPAYHWASLLIQDGPGTEPEPNFRNRNCHNRLSNWEKLNRGVSKPGGFPLFSGKVQIVSRTLSGLFLIGAVNRTRKRKRTNRENSRTIPGQIGKIPGKSGKDKKRQNTDKKGRTSPDWETPSVWNPPV